MLKKQDILMGREKLAPLTKEMEKNLENLLEAVNKLLKIYNKPVKVSSGYRPPQINANVGGVKLSAHQTCEAVDIADPNNEFAKWCLNNLKHVKECGLYLEDPRWTPTWVHLQIRRPASGKLVFVPDNSPPKNPKIWDGKINI